MRIFIGKSLNNNKFIGYDNGQGIFRCFVTNEIYLNTVITNLKSYLRKGKDLNNFKKFLNKKAGKKIVF